MAPPPPPQQQQQGQQWQPYSHPTIPSSPIQIIKDNKESFKKLLTGDPRQSSSSLCCGKNTATSSAAGAAAGGGCGGIPPVEDVMRWKEFRRRQKMESQVHHQQQQEKQWQSALHEMQLQDFQCGGGGGVGVVGADQAQNEVVQQGEVEKEELLLQPYKLVGRNRKSLGAKISGEDDGLSPSSALPHLDSLSLSLSDSTSLDNHNDVKQQQQQPPSSSSQQDKNQLMSKEMMNNAPTSSTSAASSSSLSSSGRAGERGRRGGGIIEIIDTDGFPISPTSLNSDELREGKSTEEEEEGNDDGAAAMVVPKKDSSPPKECGDTVNNNNNMEQQVQKYFSTLDCSVSAIRRRENEKVAASRSNMMMDSKSGDDCGDNDSNNNVTEKAMSEVPSQVATEITSNTARYVANQSNLMARQMMMLSQQQEEEEVASQVPTDVVNNTAQRFTQGVGSSSNLMARRMMMNATAAAASSSPGLLTVKTASTPTATAMMPALLTPMVGSNTTTTISSSNAAARMKLAATPSFADGAFGTPGNDNDYGTPGWDPTKTTVTNDLLESVLATPADPNSKGGIKQVNDHDDVAGSGGDEVELSTTPSMEPILENVMQRMEEEENELQQHENSKDVSMVSSNWDPLQVSLFQEDDEDDDEKAAAATVNPSPKSTASTPPSTKSRNSQQQSQGSSPSSSSKDIPTLDEVNNFMSQLKQLREDNNNSAKKTKEKKPTPVKKQTSVKKEGDDTTNSTNNSFTKPSPSPPIKITGMDFLPAASENEVLLKEENIQIHKSLLERKEKLRLHKLESSRKKMEFDERLKMIRSRVYTDGEKEEEDGSEVISRGTSMVPLEGKTPPRLVAHHLPSTTAAAPPPPVAFNKTSCLPATPTVERMPHETCFPTDEKEVLPITTTRQQQEHHQPLALFSPMVPAARWSGGLARWNNNCDSNTTLPSPAAPQQQQQQQTPVSSHQTPQKKLNIAVDADDFSFRPPSIIGGTNNIPISPIVASATAATRKFNFTSSPEKKDKPSHPPSSPMGTLFTTIGNVASSKLHNMSSPVVVSRRSRSSEPSNDRSEALVGVGSVCAAVGNNNLALTPMAEGKEEDPLSPSRQVVVQQEAAMTSSSPTTTSSPPVSNASPDMSEGDKGAGGFFALPGGAFDNNMKNVMMRSSDKSIISRTSSNFVELGLNNPSMDPPEDDDDDESESTREEESLLGVTIKGSKKKKKKKSRKNKRASRPSSFEPVDELDDDGGGNDEDVEVNSPRKNMVMKAASSHASASLEPSVDDLDGSKKSGSENDSREKSCDTASMEDKTNNNNRKPLDPDGFDWKELQLSKQRSEEIMEAEQQQQQTQSRQQEDSRRQSQQQQEKINPIRQQENNNRNMSGVLSLGIVPEAAVADDDNVINNENKEFVSVMDRVVKTCTADKKNDNPEFILVMDRVKTCLTPRNHQDDMEVMNGRHHFGGRDGGSGANNNYNKKVTFPSSSGGGSTIHELRCKFESSDGGSVTSARKDDDDSGGGGGGFAIRSKSVPAHSQKRGGLAAPSSSSELKSRFESSEGGGGSSSSIASGASGRFKSSSFKKENKQQTSETKSVGVVDSSSGFGASAWKKYGSGSGGIKESKEEGKDEWKKYGFRGGPMKKKSKEEEIPSLRPVVESEPSAITVMEIQDTATTSSNNGKDNDDIELVNSKSSDTMSIKELRSKFEAQKKQAAIAGQLEAYQKSLVRGNNSNIIREKQQAPPSSSQFSKTSTMLIGSSSMIGSGIYLKNRDMIQAMSSLGSETQDTAESSCLNKADSNETGPSTIGEEEEDGTIGDGTLNTKRVLRYAKILEKRAVVGCSKESEESESIKSFENSIEKKDTNNSLKENFAGGGGGKASAPPDDGNNNAVATTTAATAANDHKDDDFPNFSPVQMRKKAFEINKKPKKVAQAYQQILNNNTPDRKNLSSKKDVAVGSSKKKDVVAVPTSEVVTAPPHPPAAATAMQGESPTTATSIKDRIAAFAGGKNTTTPSVKNLVRSSNKVPRQQQASPLQQQQPQQSSSPPRTNIMNRTTTKDPRTNVMIRSPNKGMHLQQSTASPPRTIAMNRATETPSPLWVANRTNNGPGFSPMDNFNGRGANNKPVVYGNNNSNSHHVVNNSNIGQGGTWQPLNATSSSPTKFPTSANKQQGAVVQPPAPVARPAPVQTRYESPIARDNEYSDDEEDGITLSPTFSEVSGLTMPTCLGTVNGDGASRGNRQLGDVFANLSKASRRGETSAVKYHDTMSPIARHRKQQETAALAAAKQQETVALAAAAYAKISNHPYLQKVQSKKPSRGPSVEIALPPSPSLNKNTDSTMDNRIHEMKTPRARGSPGLNNQGNKSSRREQNVPMSSPGISASTSSQGGVVVVGGGNNKPKSRREQIVSRVRSSPRHKSFPQHSTNNNNVVNGVVNKKPNIQAARNSSQEWQERNVIEEDNSTSPSSGDRGNKSPVRHFDGRIGGRGGGSGGDPVKPRGRVAESVAKVNGGMKKRHSTTTNQQHQKPSRTSRGNIRSRNNGESLWNEQDQGNSLATSDCIRVD